MAIILPVMLILLAVPLFFGRAFWHYSVAQKAAHDGARYMSEIPLSEMNAPTRIGAHLAVAAKIVADEMSDLNPGSEPTTVTYQCEYPFGYATCDGRNTPKSVRVLVRTSMFDTIFANFTSDFVDVNGLVLNAAVTMPYVAN
ncbi:MAG: pilus assembly protein [Massilia sp.]|nr:pilus assembly protein [Massilia sp.]